MSLQFTQVVGAEDAPRASAGADRGPPCPAAAPIAAIWLLWVLQRAVLGRPARGVALALAPSPGPCCPPARELALLAGGPRGARCRWRRSCRSRWWWDGKPFPDRGTVLFIAFGAVVITLVFPALGMPPADPPARRGVWRGTRRTRRGGAPEGARTPPCSAPTNWHAHDDVPEEALSRLARSSRCGRLSCATRSTPAAGDEADAELHAAARDIRRELLAGRARVPDRAWPSSAR